MKCFLMCQKIAVRLACIPRRCKSGLPPFLPRGSSLLRLQSRQMQTGVFAAPKFENNVQLRQDDLVKQDIVDIYAGIREALTGTQATLIPIAQYYFNGDGKAIRPVITICLAKAINFHLDQTSPIVTENQKKVCQILEMIHVAGLYHDDVIDKGESRRNKPSVNTVWGVKKPILAGDFVLGRAMEIIAEINDEEVSILLNTMIDHIVIGEIMQLGCGNTEEERFAHYIDKTFKKTASLLAHSCQAVSLLSGGDSNLQTMAFKIGRQLGMAFQLVDDILDFSASSAQLGKPAAVDMSQGLANAPVLFAARKFPELNAMIARRFQQPGDVETAFRLILRSDGLQRTKDLATQYCDKAVIQLAQLSPSPYQQFLFTITHKLLNRLK